LAEEGLGRQNAAEKLLAETVEIRKRRLKEGHIQTLQALAHLARVRLGLGKAREAAICGVEIIRHWKFQKRGVRTVQLTVNEESVDALESVFAGRAKPSTCKDLLQALLGQLDILAWKNDYLRAHVSCLLGEATCELSGTTQHPAEVRYSGVAMIDSGLKVLESNPSIPARILEENRTRRQRWQQSAAMVPK
jgi:hypothetical protein